MKPDGLSYAMVVAHPDDDAYGAAGKVALHANDPGFRFILIHATDGGAGDIRPGFPATRESLGPVRMQEDEDAWRAVGKSPDRHAWLGLADGEVDEVSLDRLTDTIGAILDEEQPTVVETFGPDGIFGHPDHIAVGAATDAAFLRSARSTGTSFRRLLHSALPQTVFERWNAQRRALGLKVFDPTTMYHMRGVPDAEIGLTMDCRPVANRIVAGLRQHKSQHHVMSDDPDDIDRWKRVNSRSWAVVAWPPSTPATPMLTDIFEGLP